MICAIIAMIGDDPEDYMARSCMKWLLKFGVNVLTMSPAKKDYGHHNYPLERIEAAIARLKKQGILCSEEISQGMQRIPYGY